jgi:hypothetical protein
MYQRYAHFEWTETMLEQGEDPEVEWILRQLPAVMSQAAIDVLRSWKLALKQLRL